MKRLFCLVLALSLMSTPNAGAEALTAGQTLELAQTITRLESPLAFQKLDVSADQLDSTLKKMAASRPAEVTAHAGQTLLFLFTMAGVDLVDQEIHQEGGLSAVTSKNLPDLAWNAVKKIAQAAQQIPNSGSLWMSMAGGATTAKLLQAPVAALSAVIANPEANRLFFHALYGSVLLTGTQLGWDLGGQLTTEASYLLKDPADYQRSGDLFGVGKGAVFALLFSHNERDRRDLHLAKEMFHNMLEVALFNSKLRAEWFNNTWRTRWMTGQTVTFLAMVAGASIAGSMILPGGGTVAGFMFGLGGAVAAWALPDSFKNDITVGLQIVRQRVISAGQMHTNEMNLEEAVKPPLIPGVVPENERVQNIQALLTDRHGLRSNYITICFERVRDEFKLLSQNPTRMRSARAAVTREFEKAHSFYTNENQILGRLLESASAPEKTLIANEIRRAQFVDGFLQNLGQQIEAVIATRPNYEFSELDSDEQDVMKYVEVSYARGFNESELVRSARNAMILP